MGAGGWAPRLLGSSPAMEEGWELGSRAEGVQGTQTPGFPSPQTDLASVRAWLATPSRCGLRSVPEGRRRGGLGPGRVWDNGRKQPHSRDIRLELELLLLSLPAGQSGPWPNMEP